MYLLQEKKTLYRTSIIKKDGIQIQPRVDERTKRCRKRERFKVSGVKDHKVYDTTCRKKRMYGKLTWKETIRVNKQANIYFKSNQQKLKSAKKGGSNPLAATDVQAFLKRDYCHPVNNASSTLPPSPSSKPLSTSPKRNKADNDDTKKERREISSSLMIYSLGRQSKTKWMIMLIIQLLLWRWLLTFRFR